MSWLTRLLGLQPATKDQLSEKTDQIEKGAEFLEEGIEKLGTATEFLENVADKLEDADMCNLGEAIEAALPWIENTAEAIGDAVPPIKALIKIVGFLTKETDPRALGLLAFSLAYQSALADAVTAIQKEPGASKRIDSPVRPRGLGRLPAAKPDHLETFETFKLVDCLRHPLLTSADEMLMRLAKAAGWPDDLRLRLVEGVHARFSPAFRKIITDARTREKFEPLIKYIALDPGDAASFQAIERHIEYQLWCFNQAPALGRPQDVECGEPMSLGCPLKDIYLHPDCGILSWADIDEMRNLRRQQDPKRSPFNEDEGGRRPLLEQVTNLLGDGDFRDAIVIQGVAGAGKSAFTLHLCSELRYLGLRPIRIRMRHLLLDGRTSLFEDIAQAIAQNSGDQAFDKISRSPRPSADEFKVRRLFEESVPFRGGKYLPSRPDFLTDGMRSASQQVKDFESRSNSTLSRIRREIINEPRTCIRVVLTGRPSFDVQEVGFLLRKTPILTIRSLRGGQIEHLADFLLQHRIAIGKFDHILLKRRIDHLLAGIRAVASPLTPVQMDEVLGLPLLALLAIWLTLNDTAEIGAVGSDRTALYRRLVDMTCKYGGNLYEVEAAARIVGNPLRVLLRQTAASMTILGAENISYTELEHRLRTAGLDSRNDAIRGAMRNNPIASLMISFFFSVSTREQGCEFVHKSFREYLFAEAIVGALRTVADARQERLPRSPYWKDFGEDDPRRFVVRSLAPLLSAQWITGDVARYLTGLIAWEIGRATGGKSKSDSYPDETLPMSLEDWQRIRDVLVDLWDWWAEGVHLRPQPYYHPDTAALTYTEPYAERLAKVLVPIDLPRDQLPEPIRTVTIDAHLGDALFRINCALHFRINEAMGWLDKSWQRGGGLLPRLLWENAESGGARRYQTVIKQGNDIWVAFAPATPDGTSYYMESYCHRIEAAGWRPEGIFPQSVDMSGIDLAGATLVFPASNSNTEIPVLIRYGRLSDARFVQVHTPRGSDFSFTAAKGFTFTASAAELTNFADADLEGADFRYSTILSTNFTGALMKDVNFTAAYLENVDVSQLQGALLEPRRRKGSTGKTTPRSPRKPQSV